MSAALQFPIMWAANSQQAWRQEERRCKPKTAPRLKCKPREKSPEAGPVISLGFYRKHTESMLRRYLYASMQVGRSPSLLSDPIGRGWGSSRPSEPLRTL